MTEPTTKGGAAGAGWRRHETKDLVTFGKPNVPPRDRATLALLLAMALAAAAGLWVAGPLRQDAAYHVFADRRTLLGIPNAMDVLSNLPIGLAGVFGLCLPAVRRTPWALVAAVGLILTGAGSGYYHHTPDSQRLFWDRLPLTLVLTGFFAGVFADRTGRDILLPAVALGALSVVFWRYTDDLRPYAFVQYFPMLALPVLLLRCEGRAIPTRRLVTVLVLYALAKVGELTDQRIFDLTQQVVSGHTLKHLLAGAAGLAIVRAADPAGAGARPAR
jgi:hypothetical protein